MQRCMITLILIWILGCQVALGLEQYDQIRIWTGNTDVTLQELQVLGLDPEAMNIRRGVYIDAIVAQSEKEVLMDRGYTPEDIILDMSAHYATHLSQGAVRDLEFGSMGGYLTLDEIIATMDTLHVEFPHIVSAKTSIGESYEGRDIWAFKISDNPDIDEAEPEVLYNSLIHAREPAAMMTLMYFAMELAENYGTDPVISYLVDEREIWFIPVVNPDGYAYNELTYPEGGGLHRKNRRPGCSSSPGVDLNRNWGFHWGYDDTGSSPDSCSVTYRGESSFSEPETQALRDFVLSNDFQTVFNYHSYGNLLIRPYGYNPTQELPTPDAEIYSEMGQDLVLDNNYLFGTGAETVGYLVNGDAVDYMFGELGIINFTPEVGAWAQGGFWPSSDVIFELAQSNMSMNTHLAGCAGGWIQIETFELNIPDIPEEGDVLTGDLVVRNKGLGFETLNTTLYLSSPDSSLIPSVTSFDLSGLAPQTSLNPVIDDLTFEITAPSGALAQLVLSIEKGNYIIQSDTFFWNVGIADTLFLDDFEAGLELWNSDEWGTTTSAFGGTLAMTDSPFGDYPPLNTSMVTLNDPIDLRGYSTPKLVFDASWDIEIYYDFCQVLASDDEGVTWVPLPGLHTVLGNGSTVQPFGEPGYHGTQTWIHEEVSLTQFSGSPSVLVGFRLMSDNYFEGEGMSIDNLSVLGWGIGFHSGDLNRDGQVNIADAVILLENILDNTELDAETHEISDLNGDSEIDIRDLIQLIEKIIVGE